jgi:hypothetical protein
VKASLTSIPAGATLGVPSNVTITPGYQGSLDVRTGVMVKTAAASVARAVEATWTGSSPEFSAVPLRVFTNKEKPVSVTIGSVQVGSVTYSNKVAKFDIALLEGYKYTLTADLKKVVVWAGSNIYWDSSYPRMTFDAPGSGDQTRQGVLFKWGSLIGISPAAEGDYEKIYNGQYDWYVYYNDYGSNTTLYVPDYSMNSWTTSISQNVDWFDISESNVAYGENLSDDKYNTVYDYGTPWSKNLGDICRYISEMGMGPDPWAANHNYRLPTRAEMGEKSSYSYGSDGWTKSADILSGSSGYPVYSNPSTPDGAYSVPGYASNASVVFPASGYRSPIWIYNSYIDGVMLDLNVVGYYWNSSNSVEAMEIRYGGISFGGSHYNEAGSVRCVRAN